MTSDSNIILGLLDIADWSSDADKDIIDAAITEIQNLRAENAELKNELSYWTNR